MVTATYPVAPEVTPLDGTLLHVATVRDGIAWLNGEDLWASYAGMQFGQAPVFCGPNAKDLDGENVVEWVSGFLFGAYGGVTCKAVGMDMAENESEVKAAFERGESTAIERALMGTRFRAPAGENVGRWVAPTDITPTGGAVKPGVGVALLEGRFTNFAPTIHMPRTVASLLLGVDGAELDGQTIRTKLGSKVAAGAGYDYPNTSPTGTAPAEMERWLYATGNVFIGRGEAQVRSAFNQTNNDVVVLGERAYIAAVEGPVYAVRVRLDA